MEQLFGVTPIEIKKYDGANFPPLVNEILQKYKNKAFFGGGSLLHDAFFKDEELTKSTLHLTLFFTMEKI